MLMLSLICVLFGAVLGQRFKVAALIPALALVLMAAVGFAHAGTFWQILGATLVATTCLEIGYVAGVGIRYLMAAARSGHASSLTGSISSRRAAN